MFHVRRTSFAGGVSQNAWPPLPGRDQGDAESPPRGGSAPALCAVLCLWPRPACAAEHQGTASLLHYTSEIDGTRQQYGAFVPAAGPPRPEGYPVCLHYHGYGWSVSADFSDFQKRWACDHGWILANVNGRGPTFYDGIGENDVFRVLQDLDGRFGIDDRRVYATGGSMGGTGAYRQGVRWPDSFAAVVGVDGWSSDQLSLPVMTMSRPRAPETTGARGLAANSNALKRRSRQNMARSTAHRGCHIALRQRRLWC